MAAIHQERAREHTAWQVRRKDAQLRGQRVALIESGLREAIGRAPDVFGPVDVRRLAERVVDELLGG
jgi:hypothetical protein